MIERVRWHPHAFPQELERPFQRGEHERQLRITLHLSSFNILSEEEKTALDTLRNLGNLPELDTLEIQVGSFSYSTFEEMEEAFKSASGSERQIRISPFNPDSENMSIYTGDDEG